MSQAAAPNRRLARVFRARGRFLRPGDQVSRGGNRGRDANVAPGPVFLPLLVISPPTWSLPPEKYLRQQYQTGARADLGSATGPVLVCGQLRREDNNSKAEKMATSLTCCACSYAETHAETHAKLRSQRSFHLREVRLERISYLNEVRLDGTPRIASDPSAI